MRGDIEQILAALNDGGVRYLVVGGVAVVLHGSIRERPWISIWWCSWSRRTSARALSALQGLGYQPVAPVPDPALRRSRRREKSRIRDKNMIVFSLWLSGSSDLQARHLRGRALRVRAPPTSVRSRWISAPREATVPGARGPDRIEAPTRVGHRIWPMSRLWRGFARRVGDHREPTESPLPQGQAAKRAAAR